MACIHPFKYVVEDYWTLSFTEPLWMLYYDYDLNTFLCYHLAQLFEGNVSSDHDIFPDFLLEDYTNLSHQLLDEGAFGLPEATVDPDYFFFIYQVSSKPVYSRSLTTVS